jgi:hypothetical protein
MNNNNLKRMIQENKIRTLESSNKRLPSTFQMSKNLGSDIVKNITSVIQGNPINAETSVIDNRKSICNSCEFFIKDLQKCSKCGCNMAIKTYLKASNCPIGKW